MGLLQKTHCELKLMCSSLDLKPDLMVLVLLQVCEGGGRLEDVDIKGLAALTADTVIHNIHSRVAGRPAGTNYSLSQQIHCR